VGLAALLVGGAAGAGGAWLLRGRVVDAREAGAERIVALRAGGAAAVSSWRIALERASRVATSASEQLVLRVRVARSGAPAPDGGRFFFLQWAGGYESPTVVPGATPDGASLSFRLPKGVAARSFAVRFAPPDAPSIVLAVELAE
jgi:hypothetical protein